MQLISSMIGDIMIRDDNYINEFDTYGDGKAIPRTINFTT